MLYRQFAITIVVSVLISLVVALTLSPAMCAILLRPSNGKKNFVFRKINEWLARGNNKYVHFLQRALANPRRIIAGFGMAIVFIIVLNRVIPSSFLPEEDQGYFKVELALPEGCHAGTHPQGDGTCCRLPEGTPCRGIRAERGGK